MANLSAVSLMWQLQAIFRKVLPDIVMQCFLSVLAPLSHQVGLAVDSFGVSAPKFGADLTACRQMRCGAELAVLALGQNVNSLYTALFRPFEVVPAWH
jgi:hypothetical protein